MIRTVALMGTIVTIQVVGHGADDQRTARRKKPSSVPLDGFARSKPAALDSTRRAK